MNSLDRCVLEEIPNLAGLYVIGDNLRQRLIRVLVADRALVITEFDDRDAGVRIAHRWRAGQEGRKIFGAFGTQRLSVPFREDQSDQKHSEKQSQQSRIISVHVRSLNFLQFLRSEERRVGK